MFLKMRVNENTRRMVFEDTKSTAGVVGDSNVDGIIFYLPENSEYFEFQNAVVYVVFFDATNTSHKQVLDQIDDYSGMPKWTFDDNVLKNDATSQVPFFLHMVVSDTSGKVLKSWNTLPSAFIVYKNRDYNNQEEEAIRETDIDRLAGLVTTLTEKAKTIGDVEKVLASITGSSPKPVDTETKMIDDGHIYLYTGNETGFVTGALYYYIDGDLTYGGVYGGVYGSYDLDTTLTEAGKAADAGAVGAAIDEVKEDLGDKSNLETLDKTNIVSAINSLNGIVRIIANRDTSWAGIRENVKSGYGEILYPVGTDFSVSCPSGAPYNDIVFTVVNHRVENDEPIMTLLMKHAINGIQFDAIQAMICPSESMPAGTYHFKLLDGYDTAYDGGKYVQFTLANALEAGGQIVIDWPYNQTWIGKNATVYHAFGTTAVETCVMSEGTGGTYLGVADGTVSILNHTHRGRYGSNNYAESAVREWLDSDGAAGAWQTQKTKFQRPCSYNARKAGFVTYLDPEFVAIVRSGSHPNRTNQVFDLNGTKQAYSTTDKFYLLSNEEVGFTSESGIVCGTVLDFYKEAAQKDKIKYDITSQATARYWWLRLPDPSYASSERFVYSSGVLYSTTAYVGHGAAAACEI